MKIAVLDDYQNAAMAHADWSGLKSRCEVTVFDRNFTPQEAAEALKPFDVICLLRERMAVPRGLIEALPNLKMIAVTGPANRTLDLAAATERGIVVSHTDGRPGINIATAELAWGLLLSVMRNIPLEAGNMRSGGWQTTVGAILYGKTLGVLGLGKLGQQAARYGQAFGMTVNAWSQNLTEARAREVGVNLVSRQALFADSDAVSIHLVLSDRSRGLVGEQDLALMKRGAILINTSRGPIVDQPALHRALQAGAIRAGIDVYDAEPVAADDPLRSLPNVVLTPHLGYVTTETYRAFYEDTVANIEAFLEGRPIRVLKPA